MLYGAWQSAKPHIRPYHEGPGAELFFQQQVTHDPDVALHVSTGATHLFVCQRGGPEGVLVVDTRDNYLVALLSIMCVECHVPGVIGWHWQNLPLVGAIDTLSN